MPYSIKKNDLYIEVSHYRLKGTETLEDRERQYDIEAGMRAKRMLIEYALNNEFYYFVTITFDSKKQDRYDYQKLMDRVRYWFNNYQKRHDPNLLYILIPELHKKKKHEEKAALHIHGLVRLSNESHLKFKEIREQAHIFTHTMITKAYGKMNEFTKIYNRTEFIAYYITKYVGKTIQADKLTSKRYYQSQGLKTSKKITTTDFDTYGVKEDYKNQFVTKWKYTHEEFKKLYPNEWRELNESN